MNNIFYGLSEECGEQFEGLLREFISKESLIDVCDIGGGANPIFSEEFHNEKNLDYTLLDISQEELDKAPNHYSKICADITKPDGLPEEKWDLVFSQTLAEHVEDGRAFHENILRTLKPGGYAMHLFPTLYAIPFIANKFFPEKLASFILDWLAPRDRYQHEKFPAHYSWCKGPSKSMLKKLNDIGYEIIDYRGLFGHRYYGFFKPLHKLQEIYSNFLVKHPNPYQTSYVIQVLRKPL